MASTLHTLESLSQNPDDTQVASEQLKQFRQQLYSSLAYRGDTIRDGSSKRTITNDLGFLGSVSPSSISILG